MSSRRAPVDVEEAKYPEDRIRSDKDDQKTQMKEQQRGTKVDLVEQLQSKFASTDYGSSTGSPLERLEHMSKDVNAIVAERERIAKEKEKAEDAIWWEQEHAGTTSPAKTDKLKAIPVENRVEAPFVPESKSKMNVKPSEIKDTLKRPTTIEKEEKPVLNRPVGDLGIEKEKTKEKPSEKQHNDSVLGRLPRGYSLAPGRPDLTKEKESLDKTKEERRHMWDGYVPLKDDPDNFRQGELDAFRMSVTDNLPHGSIVRSRPNASSAFSPVSNAAEDRDPSRIQTRAIGRRQMEQDGVSVKDQQHSSVRVGGFDNNQKSIGHTDSTSINHRDTWQAPNQSMPHDFLESAGSFFDTQRDLSTVSRDSDRAFDQQSPLERVLARTVDSDNNASAKTWTEGSMKNRLVLPTYLPPDQRVKNETVETESSGWFGGLRSKVHDAKENVKGTIVGAKNTVKGTLIDAKDSVKETLTDAKETVEDKLDSAKDTIEDKFDSAKDTVEDGLEAAKDKLIEWKDDAAHALSGAKHTIEDKTDEFTTILKRKKDDISEGIDHTEDKIKSKTRELKDDAKLKGREIKQDIGLQADRVKLKGQELEDEISLKGHELKQDIGLKAERAKLKGKGLKDDIELKGRELKDDIVEKGEEVRLKGREMKEDAKIRTKEWKGHVSEHARIKERDLKHGVSDVKDKATDLLHDAEDEAKHLVAKVNNSWWNPLSHLRGDIKERHLEVEASPEGVQLLPVDEKNVAIGGRKAVDATIPTIDGVQPVHVPASLQGLGGGTPLPSPQMPSTTVRSKSPTLKLGDGSEPIYVPNSLRGLEDSTPLPAAKMPKLDVKLPSIDLKKTTTSVSGEPIYVPNSLRGLESSDLPSGGVHEPVKPDFKSDIGLDERTELRPKQNGFLYNLLHAFDRREPSVAESSRSRSPSPSPSSPSISRNDKLNASARDFWDLRAQDSPQPSSRSASPAPSLARSLKDDSSVEFYSSPLPERRTPIVQEWDILHDRQFEELMAETME